MRICSPHREVGAVARAKTARKRSPRARDSLDRCGESESVGEDASARCGSERVVPHQKKRPETMLLVVFPFTSTFAFAFVSVRQVDTSETGSCRLDVCLVIAHIALVGFMRPISVGTVSNCLELIDSRHREFGRLDHPPVTGCLIDHRDRLGRKVVSIENFSNIFNCSRLIGNWQMYEALDDMAAQIILAIESGDSIRRVAQRLHTPYETVRQAVNRLEAAGYVSYDDGLSAVDDHVRNAARELMAASARVSPPSIEEAYVIPQFGEWPFAFTRIDAVYVWTQGGYQVGRDPTDYPLFLAVREQDVDDWEEFFESFGLPVAFERQPRGELTGALQIVLDPQPSLNIDHVEGYPVIPREDTIEYMHEHYAQLQSALAMLDRMYEDLDLGVAYREIERVQS
jgi:DNA-binding Lrp family transcriptional regulator